MAQEKETLKKHLGKGLANEYADRSASTQVG
jgi:hypothetical protein